MLALATLATKLEKLTLRCQSGVECCLLVFSMVYGKFSILIGHKVLIKSL